MKNLPKSVFGKLPFDSWAVSPTAVLHACCYADVKVLEISELRRPDATGHDTMFIFGCQEHEARFVRGSTCTSALHEILLCFLITVAGGW